MTDMGTRIRQVFAPRFMLAMLLATSATFAQDATDPKASDAQTLEPAVATGAALEPSEAGFEATVDEEVDPGEVDSFAAHEDEREALEPGVTTSAVLAADVTRQQAGGQVMDRLELGRTEITGNQELPKVLYIVPWKRSDPGDLMGRPVNTLLDEVLAPLDREEFVRQVEYYGDLYVEEDE